MQPCSQGWEACRGLIYLLQPHVGCHQLILLILGQQKVERTAISKEKCPISTMSQPPMEEGAEEVRGSRAWTVRGARLASQQHLGRQEPKCDPAQANKA